MPQFESERQRTDYVLAGGEALCGGEDEMFRAVETVKDEELLKRDWAVLDSFRHIQHEVVHGVLEWLPTVLDFCPWDLSKEQQRALWNILQQRAAARALEHIAYPWAAVGQLIADGAMIRGWPFFLRIPTSRSMFLHFSGDR